MFLGFFLGFDGLWGVSGSIAGVFLGLLIGFFSATILWGCFLIPDRSPLLVATIPKAFLAFSIVGNSPLLPFQKLFLDSRS